MNAVELKNVSKSYKDFKIDDLSLTLPCGYILGLVGENGAGKTTLIKMILDIVHKDSGNINVFDSDNQLLFEATKENIGVVIDENCFHRLLNPVKISKIMSKAYKHWDDELFFSYLDLFDVPKKKRIAEMSKGMKVKLNIAVAASHNAKLLILDEPMDGLDPIAKAEVTDLLIEFTRDESHSVLISSHNISNLEKMCDYFAFLHDGKLLLCEEKDVLKDMYCSVNLTDEQLKMCNQSAILSSHNSKYGVEAIALRNELPDFIEKSPVSIEELFVAMLSKQNKS